MLKRNRIFLYLAIVAFIILFRFLIKPPQQKETGPFLGQTPPDSIPKVFAPGFISDQFNERDATFTPNGREFYYSLWTGTFGVILQTKQVDGVWTAPEIAPFSGSFSDIEPFITPDGSRLYFASTRPLRGNEEKDYDIWYVSRKGNGWGEAVRLDSTINTKRNEFYPTLTNEGTLYFTAYREDGFGGEDIYRSRYEKGEFLTPENCGANINSVRGEFNALIAPDESYLLFSSFGRDDELGGGDLYISFNVRGSWTKAKNLGEPYNSPRLDYCPALSPDGVYFLFSSHRSAVKIDTDATKPLVDLHRQLSSVGNGGDDIYWVESAFIHTLKQRIPID